METPARSNQKNLPYRIPITAISVFGASSLLALAVGIVLYLGLSEAADKTRQLWANEANTLIDAMEQSLEFQMKPVSEQARWIAREINDLSDLTRLDDLIIGTLAATPQVAGIAVVSTDGRSRRWSRNPREAISEDWSQRANMMQWLADGKLRTESAWQAPIWADPLGVSTLLHDIPLHNQAGEYIGLFAQVVPISELSQHLASSYRDAGLTPFVLYDQKFVLAHPSLVNNSTASATRSAPLPTLVTLGDPVLEQIWSPNQDTLFMAKNLGATKSSGSRHGDDYYLFLHRELNLYGPAPWTLGAYINTSVFGDHKGRQMMIAASVSLVVLTVAVLLSIYGGRKISQPIEAIARAANLVALGKLDQAPRLEGSRIRELDDAARAFNHMVKGLSERELIRETLGRFVPESVATRLLASGGQIQPEESEATILFCDIEAFTQLTEVLGPARITDVLNTYFSAMVNILEQHGGIVTQFQGDAILATFNVPVKNTEHALNALQAGVAMLAHVKVSEYAGEKLAIRIGINTGQVVAGAIGAKGRLSYTVHGDAVNLAARLESLNKEYGTRLLLSEYSALQIPDIVLRRVGESAIRGQTHTIQLFTIESAV